MKRSTAIVLALVITVPVLLLSGGCSTYVQGRPGVYEIPEIERVAVLSCGDKEFTDSVTEVLVHCSKWQVFDREALERIMREQDMEQTDRFDKETAIQLGKLAGVDMMVFGSYGDDRAVIKAVDVENGRYYVYKNVFFDPSRSKDFKAWFTCQYLVPYAIRYEEGQPVFVWCGGNVDRVAPRDLP